MYEIPEEMDLSQDSDIELIGSTEPGYTKVRGDRVKDLLTYFKAPEVSGSAFFRLITPLSWFKSPKFPWSASNNQLLSTF